MGSTTAGMSAGCMIAIAALVGACGGEEGGTETSGLAGPGVVIACSDHAFWGTVKQARKSPQGLQVTFEVNEWVRPTSGGSQVTLVADDPAQHPGAPGWPIQQRGLVVDDKKAPLNMLSGDAAERAATAWKQGKVQGPCPSNY